MSVKLSRRDEKYRSNTGCKWQWSPESGRSQSVEELRLKRKMIPYFTLLKNKNTARELTRVYIAYLYESIRSGLGDIEPN